MILLNRIKIALSVCVLLGCHELLNDGEKESGLKDFDEAWNHINETYPFQMLAYKGIDWNLMYDKYLEVANEARGEEIVQVLADLTAELQDGHIRVYTKGGASTRPFTPERVLKDEGAFDPETVHSYLVEAPKVAGNQSFEFGFFPNNIGYLRISSFSGSIAGSEDEIDDIIHAFADTSGMILDLRENRGGSSFVYDNILARFIDGPIDTEYAISNQEIREPYTITPAGRNGQYLRPIVVLINGTSFSGTEVFADRVRSQDHMTLLGDTTAGGGIGSSTVDPRFYLSSGRSIKVNYEIILRRDSIPIERNGVVPDILIEQRKTDIKDGRDLLIESALELLSN